MKVKIIRFHAMLLSCLLLITCFAGTSSRDAYGADGGMKITGLYLQTDHQNTDKEEIYGGDATVIESNGSCLLMDCGADTSATAILKYLRGENIKSVDIYISHLHVDHYGGLQAILNSEIKVNRIYLPFVGIDSRYAVDGLYYSDLMKKVITQPARKKGCEIVGLFASPASILNPAQTSASGNLTYSDLVDNYASYFKIGNVSVQILGPFTDDLRVSDFSDTSTGSKEEHYLNNRSLVALLSDGYHTFLTAGDMESKEENQLLSQYGTGKSSRLNADIFKLSRHGLSTSNSSKFLSAVSPTWTFGQNSAQTGVKSSLTSKGVKVRKTYSAISNASKYGFVYMVGDEKGMLTITSASNQVALYKSGEKLSGLVRVSGSYGSGINWNQYYIDAKGKPLTGIQTVDNELYNFGSGGCQVMGTVTDKEHKGAYAVQITGTTYYYNPVITTDGKKRYYPSYETGVMYSGFATLNGKYLYYFLPTTGYCAVGTGADGQYSVVKPEGSSHAYAIKNNGIIRSTTGTVRISGVNYAYVGSKNHYALESGWIENYYYGAESYVRCGSIVELKSLDYQAETGANVITWSEAVQGNGYYIYRSDSYDGSYTRIKTVKPLTTVSYTDTSVTEGSAYFYKVRAYYTITVDGKDHHFGGEDSEIKSGLASAVKSFAGTALTGKAKLTWTKAAGADGYQLRQASSSGGSYKTVFTATKAGTVSKTITDLKSGSNYYFKIRAYKKVGSKTVYGPYSNVVKVSVK